MFLSYITQMPLGSQRALGWRQAFYLTFAGFIVIHHFIAIFARTIVAGFRVMTNVAAISIVFFTFINY